MRGLAARAGVVGDLVLGETSGAERVHGRLEKVGVAVVVLLEGAELELAEVGGVLLVGEAVGRNVLGLEGEGFREGGGPLRGRLAGDGKHEVNVDVFKPGGAQDGVGVFGLRGVVDAPEGL